ncbi:MAG: PadR family transcriptional regulator [Acidobacteria bacterium]|nr:MAG: PadR family transcriptional regulator [Acidobacteriota bacterium]
MTKAKTDLLQGTLDMLVLKAVALGPMHGYGILKRIERVSQEVLRVEQGSLYPALYRLEVQGLIAAESGVSENNRKARYYRITRAGRKHLSDETERWNSLAGAVNRVLAATEV